MLEKTSLFMGIYEVNKIFTDFMNQLNKKFKINYVQLMILIYARDEANMNVTALSQRLQLSRSAVSQAIICLQIKKLVTRTPSNDNKRVFYVTPTTKAKKIVDEFSGHYDKFYAEVINQIGSEDILKFSYLLDKFNSTLKKMKGEEVC